MKPLLAIAAVVLSAVGMSADDKIRITGEYVEARTAEVFAGGCIMNSGRELSEDHAESEFALASAELCPFL
jgi:hypothetical protein